MKRYIKSSNNEIYVCNHCGHKFNKNSADVDYRVIHDDYYFKRGYALTEPYYICPKCGFSDFDRVQN